MNDSKSIFRFQSAARRLRIGASRRRRGFTLMEVLAAMLLIGITLPAILNGISLATQGAAMAKHRVEAATLAEAKLNYLVVYSGSNIGADSGDFALDNHPEYRWQVQTDTLNSNVTDMMVVMVTVTWTERGADRSLSVTSLVSSVASGNSSSLGGFP